MTYTDDCTLPVRLLGQIADQGLDALPEDALKQAVKHTTIFARTTSEHKPRIVYTRQANGERVAVTGDVANDVLALSAADIGVAMGEKGHDPGGWRHGTDER